MAQLDPHVYMVIICALFLGNVILTVFVFAALCTSGAASRNRAAQLASALIDLIDIADKHATSALEVQALRSIKAQVKEVLK